MIRRWWRWLTWWRVVCPDCHGTGICQQRGSTEPHSCCGDCERVRVPRNAVPEGWRFLEGVDPLVGSGVLWRRPWSWKLHSRRPGLRPARPFCAWHTAAKKGPPR